MCDRGYRGKKKVGDTHIVLPSKPLKRDNRYQRDKKRKQCRRRAAIEPIIGHLKSDFRLSRNYLKGIIGDEINLLMAAAAWNLKKWLVAFFWALFLCLGWIRMSRSCVPDQRKMGWMSMDNDNLINRKVLSTPKYFFRFDYLVEPEK